ncbi:autotransporter outer membrane beta-barrel domain-containing protein [Myroides odoratimimus]|uniref:autotransporter outer membrane beta-barrel domain-containing protein n=1 Tax=Myroides odoratimimus TaxID=76832 RepID=UPI00103EE5D4|nr:autotransporter outer membrane beta-barrel domain-containing protein [Myroides odoratimimus]QBK77327.1 autotransporter outer membrane beta-barrel domain-containing protein [Myroides odoratimimus]WHT72762.1 autotransporter outer membrane beta-barrel domain-containing protein [Myroides odoratimimus]WHU37346.1 autotransporter outer membrane beta-barrel domain-containing protein [Myroides odoratimimus]
MKTKLLACLLFTSSLTYAQENDSIQRQILKDELKKEIIKELKEDKKRLLSWDNFTLSGYGAINYYNYGKYDTDPQIKNKFDAERLNLFLGYHFNDWISLKTEIEFEHGGTGSTIELDTQEEFGEYEKEIESGGEVKLEQIFIDFKVRPYFNVRVGRMKLHFNLAQNLDRPTNYFTAHRQEMENEILPLGWYENGIQFYGTFLKDRLRYEVSITNGLDATGFSSRNWVKRGHQTRFEMAVGNSLAYTARLDYKFGKNKNTFAGVAAYVNDAAANRPKKDMDVSAYVTIFEGHVSYDENYIKFSSVFLYGNIENSNIVSRKNANLSNNLGVKRTPVGKSMIGFSGDIGYEVLHFLNFKTKQQLYPFMRYEYYDTMYKTEGAVVRKPRWERSVITGGINWFVHPQVVLKAHYSSRRLGSDHFDPITSLNTGEKQRENTFTAGIGFTF